MLHISILSSIETMLILLKTEDISLTLYFNSGGANFYSFWHIGSVSYR